MCYPWVPYVIMAAAAAFQGYSQYQQGKFEEGVSKYNARQAENEAARVRNKGVEEENKRRRMTAELIGSQRASAGAFGVDVDSGSVLQLQEDTSLLGEVDALRIRSNFEDQAKGLDDQAELERARGRNARKQGRNALISAGLQAASFAASGYTPGAADTTATNSTAVASQGGSGVNPSWYSSNSMARSTRSPLQPNY